MPRGSATFPVPEASIAREEAVEQSPIVDNLCEIAGHMFLLVCCC